MDKDIANSRIELHRLTAPDVAVICLILSLSLALIVNAAFGSRSSSSKPVEASIYQDGQLVKRLSLKEDHQESLYDGKMLIEITGGKIRVVRSDCAHQVCVRVGWIAHSGEAISCVPYKTVIEIGSAETNIIDAVVY
ncbi:MAG: NusG domain II-containing protein [Desulfobacterales bacterium]